jgi:hypothetical protein
MANISNIVNVALIPEGMLAGRDNMNIGAIVTSQVGFLSSAKRSAVYTDSASVAGDFGSSSPVTKSAQVFFAQTPNPVNASGYLVVGFYRAVDEVIADSAGVLTGTQLSEATLIGELQAISDGSFDIDIDGGVTVAVTGVDFQAAISFADVIAELNTRITGATVTEVDQRIVITSDTTGALSVVDYMVDGGVGTFLGDIFTLASGTGAVKVDGAVGSTLTLETKVDAVTAIKTEVNFKGFTFLDNPTDLESKALGIWSQANNTIGYDVFDSSLNFDIDPTNVVWDIKLSSLSNYRMMYSKAGNRMLAVAMMSRAHTVNFNAENSALTMNLKELKGVSAEAYSQSEITSAKNVGLDIYTTVKNVPVVLTSGANDFLDNVYNLIAFVDAVQTDMFNLLKQTGTKIAQTQKGVNQLISQGEKTTRGFVRAGVFAPGTWSSPDYFGDFDTFNRSIESLGYYWLAGSLADQPQADRQARKSPVLQAGVKNAGAVHSADIVINFNI